VIRRPAGDGGGAIHETAMPPDEARMAPGANPTPPGLDAVVVMLRHGESTWVAEGRFQGRGDPPLSELGLRQAAAAAERIARADRHPALPVPADAPLEIVHSPLSRAAQTAAQVESALAAGWRGGPGLSVPRRADPAFHEIAQGEWEGLPATEIAARWPSELASWRADPLSAWAPGGEPISEVDRRVRTGLAALLGRLAHGREPGTTNRSGVLGYAAGERPMPWSILVAHDGVFKVTLLAMLDLPLARFWSFPFALCGLTVVEFVGGRARLRAHNLVDHLAALESEERLALEAARRASGAL
jgi:broad specificity phosphatase PhoE